ncbi:unnamed protein product, partial [Ectocarpus sp. 6 AP-2014]
PQPRTLLQPVSKTEREGGRERTSRRVHYSPRPPSPPFGPRPSKPPVNPNRKQSIRAAPEGLAPPPTPLPTANIWTAPAGYVRARIVFQDSRPCNGVRYYRLRADGRSGILSGPLAPQHTFSTATCRLQLHDSPPRDLS